MEWPALVHLKANPWPSRPVPPKTAIRINEPSFPPDCESRQSPSFTIEHVLACSWRLGRLRARRCYVFLPVPELPVVVEPPALDAPRGRYGARVLGTCTERRASVGVVSGRDPGVRASAGGSGALPPQPHGVLARARTDLVARDAEPPGVRRRTRGARVRGVRGRARAPLPIGRRPAPRARVGRPIDGKRVGAVVRAGVLRGAAASTPSPPLNWAPGREPHA